MHPSPSFPPLITLSHAVRLQYGSVSLTLRSVGVELCSPHHLQIWVTTASRLDTELLLTRTVPPQQALPKPHPTPPATTPTLATTDLYIISVILSFQECCINGTLWYVSVGTGFLRWHIVLESLQAVAHVSQLLLRDCCVVFHRRLTVLSEDIWAGFQSLAIPNKAAMNIHHSCLCKHWFSFP